MVKSPAGLFEPHAPHSGQGAECCLLLLPKSQAQAASWGWGRERHLQGAPWGPGKAQGAFCATLFQCAPYLCHGVHWQRQSGSTHMQTGTPSNGFLPENRDGGTRPLFITLLSAQSWLLTWDATPLLLMTQMSLNTIPAMGVSRSLFPNQWSHPDTQLLCLKYQTSAKGIPHSLPHFLTTCQIRIWPVGLSMVPPAQVTALLPWTPQPGTHHWQKQPPVQAPTSGQKHTAHTQQKPSLIKHKTCQDKCGNK